MTSISSNHPPASSRANHTAHNTHTHQPEHDVRAMRDALASARRQMPPTRQPVEQKQQRQPLREFAKAATPQKDAPDAADAQSDPLSDPLLRDRERHEEQGRQSGDGQSLGNQPTPIPVATVTAMPSPQVDPSGFAQMLADLWTRENGKGAKEISVRFGKSAWPATGARLARNAAGALDIALQVGDRGRAYGERLPGLEAHLAGSGIDVGTLAIEDDATV